MACLLTDMVTMVTVLCFIPPAFLGSIFAGITGEGGHGMGLLMLGNLPGAGGSLGYLSPQAPGPLLHQKSALEASEFPYLAKCRKPLYPVATC
jgi:hypothetical protein